MVIIIACPTYATSYPSKMTGRDTTHDLSLQPMAQQAGAFHRLGDDWTGIIDPVLRRRLQNRINQRAYRARHLRERAGPVQADTHGEPTRCIQVEAPDALVSTSVGCTLGPRDIHALMQWHERLALENYILGSPNIDHLLTLSRLNIQRAIVDNTHAMGMTMQWMDSDDAVSIFNLNSNAPSSVVNGNQIPLSLRPTIVQRRIPHHPWLDFFPFPNLRDNLIAVQDEIDDDDLCHDLMAFWDTHNTGATLLVWGPASDPQNWEVTEAFVAKWGFLLIGCADLLKSSNIWRAKRGERPLRWRR